MPRRHTKVRSDESGNVFLDVPLHEGPRAIRVSFSRWFFEPPLGDDGSIDIVAAAERLRQDITGGTIRVQNLSESGATGLPLDIELRTRDDLEALTRAFRRVFAAGLKRSNTARLAGLERCHSRLDDGCEADKDRDRRKKAERRSSSDRRKDERRRWYSPPARDSRTRDRRATAERRGLLDRRAA